MRKLSLFMISIVVVCLLNSYASLHSQPQKLPEEDEVATPVEDGVLTPQQKEHSKLYEERYKRQKKIRDQLIEKPGAAVGSHRISCPFLYYPGPAPRVVDELVGESDAIVIATFVSKASQITNDGTFVFTDYQLRVEEVLKNAAAGPVRPEDTITLTRPGGKVLLFGQIANFTDSSFKPLAPGHRYVLFLSYLPSTGAYQMVSSEGTFDITETTVRNLDSAMTKYYERDLTAFIFSVKSAVADSLKKGRQQ